MTKLKILFLIFLIYNSTLYASIDELKTSAVENCLNEKVHTSEQCLKKVNKNHVNISDCYKHAEQIKSPYTKEMFKDFCFYQIAEFPTVNDCSTKALLFFDSNNIDNGLFYCYEQHLQTMNKKNCKYLVSKFKDSFKAEHLNRQCSNF